MTPQQLRAMQAHILASPALAAQAITPEMPKVDGPTARAQDQAIADALNAEGYGATTVEVPAWRAKRYFVKRAMWRAIAAAADNHASAQVKAAAQVAVDLAEDGAMLADFADPAAVPMWAALVTAELVSPADRDEIVSWCRSPSAVTAAHVSIALRGPWGDE